MANNTAAVFRRITQARKSCKRFIPGKVIPVETLNDLLQSTLVRKTYDDFVEWPIQLY
jgi:hypothetical protein